MKKIKTYIRRKKIKKQLEIEMIETMCTIVKYMEEDCRYSPAGRKFNYYFASHFERLKELSCAMRGVEYRPARKMEF